MRNSSIPKTVGELIEKLDQKFDPALLDSSILVSEPSAGAISADSAILFSEDDDVAPEGWSYFLEIDALVEVRDYWRRNYAMELSSEQLLSKVIFYAVNDSFE